MDSITGLPKSKNWQRVKYNPILIIINRLTKMVHYKPVLTNLNAEQLTKVLIEAIIKYYGLLDFIVIN